MTQRSFKDIFNTGASYITEQELTRLKNYINCLKHALIIARKRLETTSQYSLRTQREIDKILKGNDHATRKEEVPKAR